jgi:DNA replication protein DnaC
VLRGVCQCGQPVERELPQQPWLRRAMEAAPLVCDRCIDKAEEDRRAELERDELEERARRLERRREASGIPRHLRGLDWGDPLPQHGPAVAAAQAWADDSLAGLFLGGTSGVGKSHLAGAAAWRYLDRRSLRWITATDLLAYSKSDFGSDEHAKALEVVTGTTALVIDDLDKVPPRDYAAQLLFGAIQKRVDAGAPLLVTSNLTLEGIRRLLPERFGDSIVSRLSGYCACFAMTGRDRRLDGTRVA